MTKNIKKMAIKEMFEKLSNKDMVRESIADCSVALVGFTVEGNRHRASFAASGTFAEIASIKGILTARHVIKKIQAKSPYLGLSIQQTRHHFAIPLEQVKVVEVPKPDEHANRPDLAFMLLLSQDKIGTIQTYKYFLNLDKRREQVLSEPLPTAVGFWIVSGHPAAYSTTQALPAEHKDLRGFPNKWGICGIEREYMDNGFDYIETGVDHTSGGGVPEDLGGVSGGGLWQVPVAQLKDGQTKAEEPILLGVAFRQTGVNEGKSKVICYGRRSIYGVLYDLVAQEYSH